MKLGLLSRYGLNLEGVHEQPFNCNLGLGLQKFCGQPLQFPMDICKKFQHSILLVFLSTFESFFTRQSQTVKLCLDNRSIYKFSAELSGKICKFSLMKGTKKKGHYEVVVLLFTERH